MVLFLTVLKLKQTKKRNHALRSVLLHDLWPNQFPRFLSPHLIYSIPSFLVLFLSPLHCCNTSNYHNLDRLIDISPLPPSLFLLSLFRSFPLLESITFVKYHNPLPMDILSSFQYLKHLKIVWASGREWSLAAITSLAVQSQASLLRSFYLPVI